MKKLLLILLCLPMIGFGQQTYIPDDNFEQALIDLGYDNNANNFVPTANIDTITYLDVKYYNISDLTGIEDFTALEYLDCQENAITNLDLSNNTALTYLDCWGNIVLSSLDISNSINLTHLQCGLNSLPNFDISNNVNLIFFECEGNQLTSLDVSHLQNLEIFYCSYNPPLTSLDIRNGNNYNISTVWAIMNPNLLCINVDEPLWAINNWDYDSLTIISQNCFGCQDPTACNYDSTASLNDSSCNYASSPTASTITTCDSYIWIDGNTYTASNNTATMIYTNAVGCDSIVTLDLIINNSTSSTDTHVACDPYTWIDGNTYTASNNTATMVYTDTVGCDSIVTLDLTINNSTGWQQSFSICDGDSIVIYDGNSLMTINVYDTAGNYIDTLTAGNGCDSIVYTNIIIIPPIIWYQTPLLCDGDSIAVGSSVYDTAGNYIDTLSSANGCDSIVNTYLMIDENTSSYDTLSVGASIVWNGIPLNVSGDYSVTLTNSVGCDSIVNLNLTVTTTGISDIVNNKSNLVKITDMLGQETPYRRNTPLFYIYDDGTVEKRIVIE